LFVSHGAFVEAIALALDLNEMAVILGGQSNFTTQGHPKIDHLATDELTG
jgi:hypothetical protein